MGDYIYYPDYGYVYGYRSLTYAIQAHIKMEKVEGGVIWRGQRDLPLFFLNANTQGITGASHAMKIAREILDPEGLYGDRLVIQTVQSGTRTV